MMICERYLQKKIELKDLPEAKGKESESKLKYNIYNKSMKNLKPLRIFKSFY